MRGGHGWSKPVDSSFGPPSRRIPPNPPLNCGGSYRPPRIGCVSVGGLAIALVPSVPGYRPEQLLTDYCSGRIAVTICNQLIPPEQEVAVLVKSGKQTAKSIDRTPHYRVVQGDRPLTLSDWSSLRGRFNLRPRHIKVLKQKAERYIHLIFAFVSLPPEPYAWRRSCSGGIAVTVNTPLTPPEQVLTGDSPDLTIAPNFCSGGIAVTVNAPLTPPEQILTGDWWNHRHSQCSFNSTRTGFNR